VGRMGWLLSGGGKGQSRGIDGCDGWMSVATQTGVVCLVDCYIG